MHQLIESREDCGVDALIERDYCVERKDCGKYIEMTVAFSH